LEINLREGAVAGRVAVSLMARVDDHPAMAPCEFTARAGRGNSGISGGSSRSE